jgi:hypothetical protein
MTSHELVYTRTPAPQASDARDPAADVEVERPSGPAAAVVLAAGLSCFVLGLLSVLAAASGWVNDALTLSDRVGEVSGISVSAAAVFFGTSAVLMPAWRRAEPPLLRVAAAAGVLIALGLLGTFPPFFNLFD